jgi:hypothetical protein
MPADGSRAAFAADAAADAAVDAAAAVTSISQFVIL